MSINLEQTKVNIDIKSTFDRLWTRNYTGRPQKSAPWNNEFLKYENNKIWNKYEHRHVEQCVSGFFSSEFRSFH